MHMYACMYMHKHAKYVFCCFAAFTCTDCHICMHMYAGMYAYVYAGLYAYVCRFLCICMQVCMDTYAGFRGHKCCSKMFALLLIRSIICMRVCACIYTLIDTYAGFGGYRCCSKTFAALTHTQYYIYSCVCMYIYAE
jgi:hypothetical protein